MSSKHVYKLALTALLAAASYVVFTFLQIRIPLPGGDATSFHLGNAVVVLGALLIGGAYGGLGGAIGMTIGDILDPVYVIYAPKTFILKFCIGLITGWTAHRIAHINDSSDRAYVARWVIIAGAAGMAFNAVMDPLFGYLYKIAILGKPAADVALSFNILTSCVNAVLSVIAASACYMALRPALLRSGLFIHSD